NKRITEAQVTSKDFFKLYANWTYLGIGIASLVATIWWRRYQVWTDKLTSGFLFGLPGFIYDAVKSNGTATGSRAVAEANRVLLAKQAAARALNAGRATDRTYQPEFRTAQVF
ncbi:MAG: hypothetical protein PHU23_11980, partial [Dehalococcoidales bacterium]|nr:hypothetical protein [Dehalococcoidales bacterium]